ncbi:hypothetical protein GCM10025883_00020 [Mobilicoccus caccae]|uniref:Uncharacterized protein n=1 Tax=Mobilicoccus caccae TaxID=1859295 RepID=A0ABQ6IMG6_9MICO|nr:hypothetical protein GCM10025883_00020 [Mobilicoccus caccae]
MREQRRDEHLFAVAGTDEDLALGQPVEHVRHRHAGDDEAGGLAVEQAVLTGEQGRVDGGHEVAQGGRAEQCVVGHGEHPRGAGVEVELGEPGLDRLAHDVDLAVGDAVGDHGGDVGVPAAGLLDAHDGRGGGGVGAAVDGGDDQHHPRTQVGGEGGVGGELRGSGDAGEVRSDDEHHVVDRGEGVVALDGRADGGLGVAVDLLVGDADGLLQGRLGGGERVEELEDAVGGAVLDDGAEDADPAAAGAEFGKEPDRQRGLS